MLFKKRGELDSSQYHKLASAGSIPAPHHSLSTIFSLNPSTTPPAHGERAHAPCSPSTLKPRSICPGFANDPDGDKTLADRGTFGHQCVEDETPEKVIGDNMLKLAVEDCIAFKQMLIGVPYTAGLLPPTVLQEVCLYYFDQWGFVDLVVLDNAEAPTEADMADWKFAHNLYHADSGQFWAYCLGLWGQYPTLETIRVHVKHPFLRRVDRATFTRTGDLNRLGAQVASIIAAWRRNDAREYKVSAQCGYCGVAKSCSKLAQLALEVSARAHPGFALPEGVLDSPQIETGEVMAALLDIRPGIVKAAEDWGKRALQLHDAGVVIPGYEEKRRAGKRTISDQQAAFGLVSSRIGIADFLDACSVKAPALCDAWASTFPHGEKKSAATLLSAQLEDAGILNTGDDARYLGPIKTVKPDDE